MHYPMRRPLPTLEDRIIAHLARAPTTRSQLCKTLDTSHTSLGCTLITPLDGGSMMLMRMNTLGRSWLTQLLALNSSAARCADLNVTRMSCTGVVSSRVGIVLAAVHIASPASPSLQLSLGQAYEALVTSAARQGINTSMVHAAGMDVPIPMRRNARLFSDVHPTMEGLSKLTRRWWDPLLIVDNIVRVAVFVEVPWGTSAGMSPFIYLRLSGDAGGCVVSDFCLVSGAGGLAGELKRTTVGANDSPHTCGKRGCLETLASAPVLCGYANAADITQLRATVLSDDTHTRDALERAAQAVGYVLGSAVLLTNPQAIIVAGKIVDVFPSLRPDIAAATYSELTPVMEWDIDVVGASLGPLGAAQASAYIAACSSKEDGATTRLPGEGSPREAGSVSSMEARAGRGGKP